LSPDASKLLFSTSVDGPALAADTKGSIYVAGSTSGQVTPNKPFNFPSVSLSKIDPAPTPTVIVNSIVSLSAQAATTSHFYAGSVAPGELIRIEGVNLGPATKIDTALDANGRLPFTAGGVTVNFDSYAAALISVQDTAIVCFVPFGVTQVTQLTVQFNG